MRVCWFRRSAGGKPRGFGHGDDAAVDTGADRSIRAGARELVVAQHAELRRLVVLANEDGLRSKLHCRGDAVL